MAGDYLSFDNRQCDIHGKKCITNIYIWEEMKIYMLYYYIEIILYNVVIILLYKEITNTVFVRIQIR